MDGGHLGAQDGIILLHLLGEEHPVVGAGNHLPLVVLLIPHPQSGNQGADADAGSPQVVHLINFEHRINLSGAGQDVGNLIRSHGIKAAAKGIELYQIQIILGLYKACRCIQTGVVHPLIGHYKGGVLPAPDGTPHPP